MQLLYLDPQQLELDPEGVREDPGDIAGLAATIADRGLLQPLGVVAIGTGRYRVVYGGRRRAAAVQLGLERVPCIVLDADDPDLLLRQLIENVQRQDLNDLEQARAYARLRAHLIEQHGKQPEGELDEAVGKLVGMTGRTVRRYLGLLELPEEVQLMVRRGELNVTQAQHLRRVPSPKTQLELARFAADEGMSASELSRLTAYFAANPNLTLETALQALEAGEQLRTTPSPAEHGSAGGPLAKTSGVVLEEVERDADLWDDDEANDDDQYLRVEEETVENQPKNKARVFRIRSLDQMVDETDRLSRAYVEGDLNKWVEHDDGAPFKLRLLLKQLESLSRGLRELAHQRGWPTEE
ncbi:ParB/RepB/Spo0J family partition protein [Candidatus Chloroploca sp. M-50]|uniref:ParB/RepB/Spo0J family partition protein n=1 Tax=Candidatus Chloroploca mongolica TaxID=2528176 RepID=A0ABS4D8Z0_9CHLR|nr:ParB/RepB/Spo0J family partition protein [Candidatus Chloroploca mongolica]MBP1465892.1 ParB/RepB/Spo0J family partition protein [Candidatus Chloroploca mongolica]